jgi:hypothetical protein
MYGNYKKLYAYPTPGRSKPNSVSKDSKFTIAEFGTFTSRRATALGYASTYSARGKYLSK